MAALCFFLTTKRLLIFGPLSLNLRILCFVAITPICMFVKPIQQSVPTANVATGVGVTTGGGVWTWDDVSNTVTQTGSNTLTFGPALPASVGYVLNVTGMVITGAGATTATSYTCTDGNFATLFIFASICGGYNYFG